MQQHELNEELIDEKTAKDSIAEVISSIKTAKNNKQKVLINENSKEKAKIRFDFWWDKRIAKYFQLFFFSIAMYVIAIYQDIVIFYENDFILMSTAITVFGMMLIYDEHSEKGYIRRLSYSNDRSIEEMDIYTYYIFDYVPKFRMIGIAIYLITILTIVAIAIFYNFEFLTILNIFILFLNTIFILIFELIFTKRVK